MFLLILGILIFCIGFVFNKNEALYKFSKPTKYAGVLIFFIGLILKNKIIGDNFKINFYENFSDISKIISQLLSEKNIVAWYQDKMEWGPRALGNRSILADPRYSDIQNIINVKTKKREDLALNLMSNRDNSYLIPMRQFFMDKHRNFMLHYTHNHPTSVTFVYMAEYILNIIGMDTDKIDRQTDPFGHCIEIYGHKQSYPLYSCIKKHLNFDTYDYKSCFYGNLNEGNKLIDIKDACEIYYKSYKNLNL